MGPKQRSLAQLIRGFPRKPRRTLVTLGVAAAAALLWSSGAQEEPRSIGFTERKDVRRVQLDVSVIDPKGDGLSSVPGLPKELFEVRLDGSPLTPEELARVEFDEICPARKPVQGRARENGLADDRPAMIVFVDLNFLDIRGRHATARALEDLSQMAAARPMRVKVVAYTRRIIPLTSDFTTDPAEIARAGQALVEIPAAGPPLGRLTAAPNLLQDGATPIDSRSLAEQTDTSVPPNPDRALPAFSISVHGVGDMYDETGRLRFPASPTDELVSRDVDPRPSLSAIETVLLSHAALRGRKALVLFSSSWFDLPESFWLSYLVGPRQAAQGGFTIWGVDARGLDAGLGSHTSGILNYLAASTGGDLVRSAGRLAVAFEHALSQLSCYYLFTIPVTAPREGVKEHNVDVRLDTRAHPELWSYRVRTVAGVTLLNSQELRERRRLAALMEPDAHRLPEVRLTASYPSGGDKSVTLIEVSTLLADLTFVADKDAGAYSARFAMEGLVTDTSGRTICRIGDGQERRVRVGEPPARFPPSLLVVQTRCTLPGAGRYEARVIVEDRTTDDIGAATAQLEVSPLHAGLARVSALRLGRSSGRDFLLDLGGPKSLDLHRDQKRMSFVPLEPGEGILPADRLVLRFVACGVVDPPQVILYQRRAATGAELEAGAKPAPRALFQALIGRGGLQKSADAACGEYEAWAPENTLAPGDYGLMLLEPPPPERDQPLPGPRKMLGAVEFRVLTPSAPPPETPRRQA